MELNELVGMHQLTGVDLDNASIKTWGDNFENCQVINFVLDGQTYTATEDPEDGYRSCMREIVASDHEVKNKFSCEVLGKMREDKYEKNDVLELIDAITGKVVLSVGTGNTDDYYPYWVAEFTPENMASNAA